MNLHLTAPSTSSRRSADPSIRRVAARSAGSRRVGDRRCAPAAILDSRSSTRVPMLAFSLIEILVVVALLSVIIIGLVAMFGQVQRAFRTGMTQVDVLEGGRATTDLLARDLVSITPSHGSNAVNFFAANVASMTQPLPGTTGPERTNVLGELFFLSKENQTWSGTGYRVSTPAGGVGALYRFSSANAYGKDPALQFSNYNNTPLINMSRIMDGVVHFKIRAFDTNGVWITGNLKTNTDIQMYPASSAIAPGEIKWYWMSNSVVPASVEFELGVLEQRALERFNSIPAGPARQNYLKDQAGKVHVFRMRVPVRNVDPAAYQ